MANLPGDYAPPAVRLLVATADDEPAGCVALRAISPAVCEMNRLLVRPEFRGNRLGFQLSQQIIEEARTVGNTTMRLITLRSMTAAVRL